MVSYLLVLCLLSHLLVLCHAQDERTGNRAKGDHAKGSSKADPRAEYHNSVRTVMTDVRFSCFH